MKLTTNIKLIFASWKGCRWLKKDVRQAHTFTTPMQGSAPVVLTKVTTKTSVNQTPERTGQWDWSDVTAPPRGDPTLQLTFISSQISWVWLSLSFAQRGAASPRWQHWHVLLACHWVLERPTCVQSSETSAPIHDVGHENAESPEQNTLQSWGLMGTKRLIWESAQGPLAPAALDALCREWRLRVLGKPTGIYIFSFLCGWCSYTEQFV